MKVQQQVSVEQYSYQVGQAVAALISSIKKDIEAGGGLGVEIPKIISDNLNNLMAIISAAPQIPAESKDDMVAFIKSWAISAVDIAGIFIPAPAPVPAPAV